MSSPMRSMLAIPFLVLAIVSAQVLAELGYQQGDWLRYRYTASVTGNECVYIVKVIVKEVNGTLVKYDAAIEKLEKGDGCSGIGGLLVVGLTLNSMNPVDVSMLGPDSGGFFISPEYTGTYNTSKGRLTYYRGVLVSLESEWTTGIIAQVRLELVGTSISWLKPYASEGGASMPILTIALVVAVAAAAGIGVLAYTRLRRKQSPPPPQPGSPGPGGSSQALILSLGMV
ncbi:hypothetical protein [Desulfurococcus amylolyticus]|uniref:Uncharacterized protein n=1 Tax=Desulfurococcus amylolyticus DSM 16532 TaxID=768672 RepID=I3XR39_DESAM|nr:hypothetical protein [Desulfurococcus amylolyticus]AFL66413.1 hypothetical protein Desfe_0509 [Desulfurococcus amylolyticus DSM 16532]